MSLPLYLYGLSLSSGNRKSSQSPGCKHIHHALLVFSHYLRHPHPLPISSLPSRARNAADACLGQGSMGGYALVGAWIGHIIDVDLIRDRPSGWCWCWRVGDKVCPCIAQFKSCLVESFHSFTCGCSRPWLPRLPRPALHATPKEGEDGTGPLLPFTGQRFVISFVCPIVYVAPTIHTGSRSYSFSTRVLSFFLPIYPSRESTSLFQCFSFLHSQLHAVLLYCAQQ